MTKRLILILMTLVLSFSLSSKELGQSMVAINFAGGPSYFIGFSSTKVDSRNHIAADISNAEFTVDSSGDRVATFYIYWKVYVTDPVDIAITAMPDLTNPAGSMSLSYASTSTIEGNTLKSGSSVNYTIYSETVGSKTAPRINSEQITLKLDLDEATIEQISTLTDANKVFNGTMTIKLTTNA